MDACFVVRDDNGQFSAAVSASKEKSILSGHRVERREIGAPGEFDNMTDDELERVLVEQIAELGLGETQN